MESRLYFSRARRLAPSSPLLLREFAAMATLGSMPSYQRPLSADYFTRSMESWETYAALRFQAVLPFEQEEPELFKLGVPAAQLVPHGEGTPKDRPYLHVVGTFAHRLR